MGAQCIELLWEFPIPEPGNEECVELALPGRPGSGPGAAGPTLHQELCEARGTPSLPDRAGWPRPRGLMVTESEQGGF